MPPLVAHANGAAAAAAGEDARALEVQTERRAARRAEQQRGMKERARTAAASLKCAGGDASKAGDSLKFARDYTLEIAKRVGRWMLGLASEEGGYVSRAQTSDLHRHSFFFYSSDGMVLSLEDVLGQQMDRTFVLPGRSYIQNHRYTRIITCKGGLLSFGLLLFALVATFIVFSWRTSPLFDTAPGTPAGRSSTEKKLKQSCSTDGTVSVPAANSRALFPKPNSRTTTIPTGKE